MLYVYFFYSRRGYFGAVCIIALGSTLQLLDVCISIPFALNRMVAHFSCVSHAHYLQGKPWVRGCTIYGLTMQIFRVTEGLSVTHSFVSFSPLEI